MSIFEIYRRDNTIALLMIVYGDAKLGIQQTSRWFHDKDKNEKLFSKIVRELMFMVLAKWLKKHLL